MEAYNADVAFGYLYIQRMLGFADYKRQALFVFMHICFTTNKLVDQRDILGQDAIVKLLMNSKCSYREGEVFYNQTYQIGTEHQNEIEYFWKLTLAQFVCKVQI